MRKDPDGWDFWTIVAATIYTLLVIAITVLTAVGIIGALH